MLGTLIPFQHRGFATAREVLQRARLLEREEQSETRRRLLRREEWRGRRPVLLAGLLLGLVLGGGGAWPYSTYGPPGATSSCLSRTDRRPRSLWNWPGTGTT